MDKMHLRVSAIDLYLAVALFFFACGPSAQEREAQCQEDSLRLYQERIDLLERTGQMLDSVKAAPEEDPK